jgi:manganese-dependent inorganic pyrophosphatase
MPNVFIIGHKNPDTDSICSALSYAALRNSLEKTERYVPVRIGDVSAETKFVLEHFNIAPPIFMENVKSQVMDLNINKVPTVQPEFSLKSTWQTMKEQGITTLCVSKEAGVVEGIITIGDLAKSYLEPIDNQDLAIAKTPVTNLLEVLEGRLLSGDEHGIILNGKILVGAMDPETMKDYIHQGDAIILGNRVDNQLEALESGASLLILTGNYEPQPQVIDLAIRKGATVLLTGFDTFHAANLINQSFPVSYFMKARDLVTFEPEDYLEEIKDTMTAKRYRNFPVIDNDGQYQGMISRALLLNFKRKQVILVDHNERAQAIDGLEEADILEIIDHHRIGDIQTSGPVVFRNQPVGCTATLIAQLYHENQKDIPPAIAGILCCAIMSDTLMLKSPTCTEQDRQTVSTLSSIAKIEPMNLALEMFRAGSDLKSKTTEELFYQDFKRINNGKVTIGIGQINSPDAEELLSIKDALQRYMNTILSEGNFDYLFFMLTDIAKEGTWLLYAGDCDELIANTFQAVPNTGLIYLPGILSRKKQIVPPLLNTLKQRL